MIETLKAGVKRTEELVAVVTDYHGGPVTTEYLLTSDIAREFILQDYEVSVEYLNRYATNLLTASDWDKSRKFLGSKRTDIALTDSELIPLALIELKIGVKTLNKVRKDLHKISDTISLLKPKFAKRVIGAVVFQVHVAGSKKLTHFGDFKSAVEKIEKSLRDSLIQFSKGQPGFSYDMVPLQGKNQGIVPRDIEPEDDGKTLVLGEHGHATRYYAMIIEKT